MAKVNIRNLERQLKALANKRRLGIIAYIKRESEASVGDIAEAIKLSIKATSKHLTLMFAADLLEREQKGLLMFYRVDSSISEPISDIISYL